MEVNGHIGATAGEVWQALSDDGPLSVPQLKRKIHGSGELLQLAIGWLAREDKVIVTQERRTMLVRLR